MAGDPPDLSRFDDPDPEVARRSRALADDAARRHPGKVSGVPKARRAPRRATPKPPAPAPDPVPTPAPDTKPTPSSSRSSSSGSGSGVTVSDASGFMLAILAWGWVGLPFLRNGVDGVRDVWRAKFLNKGPKGEVLL